MGGTAGYKQMFLGLCIDEKVGNHRFNELLFLYNQIFNVYASKLINIEWLHILVR